MTTNVFGNPTPDGAQRNSSNGIAQVVLNVAKHLPEFGFRLVNNPDKAHLLAHHAGSGEGQTDVAHCHGLYPTGMAEYNLSNVHSEINRRVIADIRGATVVTVPSEWVAQLLRFEFGINPVIVPWSVDTTVFKPPKKHKGYVLWNKNRIEGVCSPEPLNILAAQLPRVEFISTFGNPATNVQLTGLIPHKQMIPLIREAAVYLATTPETGDIGSREALASGVPVLGFNYGALPDIVKHGHNGFLAEPGDLDGLAKGLEWCLKNRAKLSKNALASMKGDSWQRVARQFAAVYKAALEPAPDMTISVIIPCYNYAHTIERAIKSVLGQETAFKFELIVVNDGSTDNSDRVISELRKELTFRYISQENMGVGHARNNGIKAARGEYIVCMDADDRMAQTFLDVCAAALRKNSRLGIAYTGIYAVNGNDRKGRPSEWPAQFDLTKMLHGQNQVPSLCMFRRIAHTQAGGYRQRYHPAEDARLWWDIVELGWLAEKVTPAPLFFYDMHADSASRDKNGAVKPTPNYRDNKGYLSNGDLPAGLGGTVINRDPPLISVIVPVGKGHARYLPFALDSVYRQSLRDIECVVVNDTGDSLDVPIWCKTVDTQDKGNAAYARNMGLDKARGSFVVFLDADDQLYPRFCELTYRHYKSYGGYIYTDYLLSDNNGRVEAGDVPQFDQYHIFEKGMFHAITCLIPRSCIGTIRFDEGLPTWEDFDFFMNLIQAGVCGTALKKQLFLYRMDTGTMRQKSEAIHDKLLSYLWNEKWRAARHERKMTVCGCNSSKMVKNIPANSELVQVEYHPERRVNGIANGRHNFVSRRGGNERHVYRNVNSGDRFPVHKVDYELNKDILDVVQAIETPRPVTIVPAGVT